MKKVTILRKWNNPEIIISVNDESIGLDIPLDAFLTGLLDELVEPLVKHVADTAGNPSLWVSKAMVVSKLTSALETSTSKQCFIEAANKVIDAVKQESSKVM